MHLLLAQTPLLFPAALIYADKEYEKEFLDNSIYHDLPLAQDEPVLDIDLDH